MKKNLTIVGFMLLSLSQIYGQIVTEDVNFDFYQSTTNNDFANYFNGLTGITQIQTNGITGGCLLMQDSIDWGNDRGIYCSTYHPLSGDTTVTGISFKYDSTTVHINSFQRAMTIFMHPWADPNHYVIATVSGTKKIELITYAWVNTPYPDVNLLHNHWYRYLLTTAFNAPLFQVYINAEVYDLGVTGTSIPVFVNSSSHTITDNILAVDTAIQVAISGATYGGCTYIDNFHFHGRKGYSNCVLNTGIFDPVDSKKISVYPSLAKNNLHITRDDFSGGIMKVTIFNPEGEKIVTYQTSGIQANLDVSSLADGIYIVRCQTVNELTNVKIVIHK